MFTLNFLQIWMNVLHLSTPVLITAVIPSVLTIATAERDSN